jgi:hypothetical protein
MKQLLQKAVNALVNEDTTAARKYYAQYFTLKSKAILAEKENLDKGLVEGHCDACGDDYTTSAKSVAEKTWQCKCGGKKFVAGKEPAMSESLRESMNAFHVHLKGKHIDTVSHTSDDPKEVKKQLVAHDGYDAEISVTKKEPKSKK